MFFRYGVRAGHPGLQKIPVVFTATKKIPTNVLSLSTIVLYIWSIGGNGFISEFYHEDGLEYRRKSDSNVPGVGILEFR